jgi:hypothetical protein
MAITPPQNRGARMRLHGIYRHHFHGAQLLAGFHKADFGGERGASPPGKQQGRDDRSQFTHQAEGYQQSKRLG